MNQLIDPSCIPCRRLKEQLNQQYETIKYTAKQRARSDNEILAVFFDEEDIRFKITKYESAKQNGFKYEIITPT